VIRSFLSFEGVEGSGKSTQVRLVADALRSRGLEVVTTREPGGTRVGEAVRALLLDPATAGLCPEAELMLFNASRAQHVHELIRPALDAGSVVLCDRYFDASVAYQGFGRGLGGEHTLRICREVVQDCVPGRTFWLDLDPKEALERAWRRAAAARQDRFELEALAFHERVRAGYEWSSRQDPGRVVRIPAAGSPQAVFERLAPHVDELAAALGR
jgi:dTMP kinase